MFGIVCDKLNNPLPTLEHRNMFLCFHVNMKKVSNKPIQEGVNTRLGEKSVISGSCQDDGLELATFFSVRPGKAIEEREPWTQFQQCPHKAAGCTELVNCVCVCVCWHCGQVTSGAQNGQGQQGEGRVEESFEFSAFDIFLELP